MFASEERARARQAKQALDRDLPGARHRGWPATATIVGVGLGAKLTGGQVVADAAIRVYVLAKLPADEVPANERVPRELDGLPTDVIAVGDVRALPARSRQRPAPGGVSVGHPDITAGTLGCWLRVDGRETPHLLSNNHVLANSDRGEVGDPVWQPGPADGGTADDALATLADVASLDPTGDNALDAAIAAVDDPDAVDPAIHRIGVVEVEASEAALYQSVRKHGRTTGHTVGVIMDVAADIDVRFGSGTIRFVDQIAVVGAGREFSDGGDSGSLVLDAVTTRPTGLLFAGGQGTTFANPIDVVLDRFEATVLGEADDDAGGGRGRGGGGGPARPL